MRDEELQILKITLAYRPSSIVKLAIPYYNGPSTRYRGGSNTVIAPRACEHLLDIGMPALLFAHFGELKVELARAVLPVEIICL